MKKTPLYECHQQLRAKIIDFGGWQLPVQYSSIAEEHHAVRKNSGIFDVSHMGEFTVDGKDAEKFINRLVTNDIQKIANGQAMYTVLCNPNGGIVDDLIVYKKNSENFFLCVNAANIEKDFSWIKENKLPTENVVLQNVSEQYGQIAIQGPKSATVLQKICSDPLSNLKYFRFLETKILEIPVLLARTGYTGEDGFELYIPAANAPKIWNALLEHGKPEGIQPCGLGARDTLRLEASLALYGNDIDDNTTPLEAGLSWVVKMNKTDFIGKNKLENQLKNGIPKKLCGLRMTERIIPRSHYEVYSADGSKIIGSVTSGTLSPTLDFPIAMAYIDNKHIEDKSFSIKIRDKLYPAISMNMPFYRRRKE